MSNLTRVTAVLLAACMCALMITGCAPAADPDPVPGAVPSPSQAAPAPSSAAPAGGMTAGTYSATANGYRGPVGVETVVDETQILSVTITDNVESAGVQQVINVVPEAIVEHQSLSVDTVSGASFAGRAVLAAVEDCLGQAGADIESFKKAVERTPLANRKTEADVIVIGAGAAGLSAAVSAAGNGASVIVLEKLGMPGGSTIFSGGFLQAADIERGKSITMNQSEIDTIESMIAAEPQDDFEAGLQPIIKAQYEEFKKQGGTGLFDSPEFHALQTYIGGDRLGDPALITVMCDNALGTSQWMEQFGTTWNDVTAMATGGLWQRSHSGAGFLSDGLHSVLPYVDHIGQTENVEIQYYTKAEELIVQDGRVVGVKATALREDNASFEYVANKAVVMATGGFGANVEMRQEYNEQWDTLDSSIMCSNQLLSATGDGIVMGESVGAQLVDMGLIQLHPNGEIGTGYMLGVPGTAGLNKIYVNSEGKRFINEDARRDEQVRGIYAQPGSFMWSVADSTRFPADDQTMINSVKLGKSLMANTVEELAALMEVDAANLQASIDEYNATVDGAADPFGLKIYDQKLGNPPYYAAKRVPTIHHTMGGLKIDTGAHVIGADGNPIPGFYAAGEVTGDIHGGNRLGGNALADANTFGRIAGANAAKEQA